MRGVLWEAELWLVDCGESGRRTLTTAEAGPVGFRSVARFVGVERVAEGKEEEDMVVGAMGDGGVDGGCDCGRG